MASFVIDGGRPLNGSIRPIGNKNAALPMLAACLLTDEPVTLHNVPTIGDVRTMLTILGGLGVEIEEQGATVRLCARALASAGARPPALQPNPRLADPHGPAAGAHRPLPGGHRRRRRRHRPAAHRHASAGVRRARRPPRPQRQVRAAHHRPAARLRHPPGRGVGDGHRERHHGRGAGAGHDDAAQRRQRAPRARPLPPPGPDGLHRRGHRQQRAVHPRPGAPARRRNATSARTSSRSAASSASAPSRAASCASSASSPTICA